MPKTSKSMRAVWWWFCRMATRSRRRSTRQMDRLISSACSSIALQWIERCRIKRNSLLWPPAKAMMMLPSINNSNHIILCSTLRRNHYCPTTCEIRSSSTAGTRVFCRIAIRRGARFSYRNCAVAWRSSDGRCMWRTFCNGWLGSWRSEQRMGPFFTNCTHAQIRVEYNFYYFYYVYRSNQQAPIVTSTMSFKLCLGELKQWYGPMETTREYLRLLGNILRFSIILIFSLIFCYVFVTVFSVRMLVVSYFFKVKYFIHWEQSD